MSAVATNEDGLRVFDPANLPPIRVLEPNFKEGFAPPKVSLSNPTSSREVLLRDGLPENVVLLADWMRGLNARGADFVRALQQKSPPWQKAIISNLYRRFITPLFPERFTIEHYNLFLALTLPSLVQVMVPDALRCLCAAVHWRQRHLLLKAKVTREKHRRRCMAVMCNAFVRVPPQHPEITKPLHQQAWRILWALAVHKGNGDGIEGKFFISSRELRDRLFIKGYKQAERILTRFCKIGVICKLSSGDVKWKALAEGRKPKSNTYQLVIQAECPHL